ncbi:hypothetical protein MMC17_009412 [Xylographa soralifera]|nr:hypothetical protein [Xylographa soralifera]
MRLLECKSDDEYTLHEFTDRGAPAYAILSHTWADKREEVSFEDIEGRTGKSKAGYKKLDFCAKQAAADGFIYFWIDTCCIKRSSDAELSESINSMFRWYQRAEKCYVYLSDVSTSTADDTWRQAFRASRWFTRGWTLQELLAPASVEFFSAEGCLLGNKRDLVRQIHDITGIPKKALLDYSHEHFTISKRMSWGKTRQTTREEDETYCLIGLLSISMPACYGEGRKRACDRLLREIEMEDRGKLLFIL